MTNISKISRSLIVVLFIAVMVFLGYQDIMISINNVSRTLPIEFIKISNLYKLLYVFVLIILVIMYVYLKEKLYKIKIKRNISLIIRYVYLTIIGFITSILTLFQIKNNLEIIDVIICAILSVLTGVVIKKIIFNVSKSDILSVIGMISYTSIIDIINIKANMYIAKIIVLLFVSSIFVMQILIDELKQKGIKNKKYAIYAFILGALTGLCIILGINGFVYIALAILIFFIGSNLDNAHLTFPRKAMEDISKEKREFLFKIERINISKLFISVMIVVLIATCIFVGMNLVLHHTGLPNVQNGIIIEILNNYNTNCDINNINYGFSNMIGYFRELLLMSRSYYTVLIIYILFMEILAFVLNRRYDTKSTVMKLMFMLIFLSIIIFNLNLTFYQPLLTVILIMIAIVNTSNIYLNREERIKLLVA